MMMTCKEVFCKLPVPAGFKSDGLCVEHFVRKVEAECEEIRRQTLSRTLEIERQADARKLLSGYALELVRLGTSGIRLTDATRCHILNAVLMLMHASERVARLGAGSAEAAAEASGQPAEQAQTSPLPVRKRRLVPVCPSEVAITPPDAQPAEA
jgi:hypothetical protein